MRPRFVAGPCLVCGGRVLRNGKRRHSASVHDRVRAERRKAQNLQRRSWPPLAGRAALLAYCDAPPALRTSGHWACKIFPWGTVIHVPRKTDPTIIDDIKEAA